MKLGAHRVITACEPETRMIKDCNDWSQSDSKSIPILKYVLESACSYCSVFKYEYLNSRYIEIICVYILYWKCSNICI